MNGHHALPRTLFKFIFHFLKEFKWATFIYIFLALAAGLWGPFNSILIKNLIDLLPTITELHTEVLVWPITLIVLNFILFDNLTWRGMNYIRAKYIPRILSSVTTTLLDYSLKKSHQFYQENLSGKISKEIANLVEGVEKLTDGVTSHFLRAISLLMASFIASFCVNPCFSVILFVWFLFFSTISVLMSKKLVKLSDQQALSESIMTGEIVDTLSNHANIRIFSRRGYEQRRIGGFLKTFRKAYTRVHMYSLLIHIVQGILIAIMMGASTESLIYLYAEKQVTVGDFALILGLSMEMGHVMWFTMSEVDEFNKAVGRCKQSLVSLMKPLEILDPSHPIPFSCKKGKIVFENVKFNYKGAEPLFQNKSVEIESGQKIGLVGYSGSGKSTFIHLILRLHEIRAGSIKIDDVDIRTISQETLRENIAMIPQEPSLFNRTLMENIRYGRIEATDEEVYEACKKAHADEFIQKLPLKYETLVGERGIKLSGGQRQRISIARAILKNAPILVLDEATSQLDSVTEGFIQESLWELMEGKTTIVVAHRLSTLLHMDRILVFEKGKIIEDGSHNELACGNGLYRKLWESQVGDFLGDYNNDDEEEE